MRGVQGDSEYRCLVVKGLVNTCSRTIRIFRLHQLYFMTTFFQSCIVDPVLKPCSDLTKLQLAMSYCACSPPGLRIERKWRGLSIGYKSGMLSRNASQNIFFENARVVTSSSCRFDAWRVANTRSEIIERMSSSLLIILLSIAMAALCSGKWAIYEQHHVLEENYLISLVNAMYQCWFCK